MEYEPYLAHHGILGMHWGVRRYQNRDGSLTPAGEKRYQGANSSPRHTPSSARKQAKARKAALEKARKTRAEKLEFEKKRQAALKTGNATEVLKYKNFSTRQELEEAINRINTEKKLSQLAAEEARGRSKVTKFINAASNFKDVAQKGIDAWNMIAKFHNSTHDEEDAWQVIGEKSVKIRKREIAKEKAEKALNKAKLAKLAEHVALNDGNFDTEKKLADALSLSDYEKLMQKVDAKKAKKAAEDYELNRLATEYAVKTGSKAAAERVNSNGLSLDDYKTLQSLQDSYRANKEQEAAKERDRAEREARKKEQEAAKERNKAEREAAKERDKAEREAAEAKAEQKRRDRVRANYLMDHGSVSDIFNNERLFSTSAEFEQAVQNAIEREQKAKQKGK